MGTDACFFPIFHSSTLLPFALPSPFKYVEEAEYSQDTRFLSVLFLCTTVYDKLLPTMVINFLKSNIKEYYYDL